MVRPPRKRKRGRCAYRPRSSVSGARDLLGHALALEAALHGAELLEHGVHLRNLRRRDRLAAPLQEGVDLILGRAEIAVEIEDVTLVEVLAARHGRVAGARGLLEQSRDLPRGRGRADAVLAVVAGRDRAHVPRHVLAL